MEPRQLNEEMTRSAFLRRTAAVGALVAGGPLVTQASAFAAAGSSIGGRLDVYTWEGYELKSQAAAWRKQNGVKLNVVGYIGQGSDVLAKIKSPAGKGIDLSSADPSVIDLFKKAGIMTPITVQEVPALKQLYPFFQRAPWRNPDGTYAAVPWTWGPLGLTYRPGVVPTPKSWDVMFSPKYKGRVGLLDDSSLLGNAAVNLGFRVSRLTPAQLEKCKRYMIRVLKQAKTLSPTFGDIVTLLASGEIDMMFAGWPQIDSAVAAKGGKAKTVIPREGCVTYVDSNFIPPTVDNRATALAFIQQSITGKVAAAAANDLPAAVTNPQVVPLLSGSAKALVPYANLASLFRKLQVTVFPATSGKYVSRPDLIKAWEDVKAAG